MESGRLAENKHKVKNDLTKVKAMGMENRHGSQESNSPMLLEEEVREKHEEAGDSQVLGESI